MKALLASALLGAAGLAAAQAAFCTLPGAERTSTSSESCLSCHDGTVAPDRHGRHVGASYLGALRAGRSLHTSGPQAPATLVAGRVACTSCHDASAGLPHALAAPMTRSALCLCCHSR